LSFFSEGIIDVGEAAYKVNKLEVWRLFASGASAGLAKSLIKS